MWDFKKVHSQATITGVEKQYKNGSDTVTKPINVVINNYNSIHIYFDAMVTNQAFYRVKVVAPISDSNINVCNGSYSVGTASYGLNFQAVNLTSNFTSQNGLKSCLPWLENLSNIEIYENLSSDIKDKKLYIAGFSLSSNVGTQPNFDIAFNDIIGEDIFIHILDSDKLSAFKQFNIDYDILPKNVVTGVYKSYNYHENIFLLNRNSVELTHKSYGSYTFTSTDYLLGKMLATNVTGDEFDEDGYNETPDLNIDFTLYHDGKSRPSLKLTWQSNSFTEGSPFVSDYWEVEVTCKLGTEVYSHPLKKVSFNEGFLLTSYDELLKTIDPSLFDNIINFIPTPSANIIDFELIAHSKDNKYKTSWWTVRVPRNFIATDEWGYSKASEPPYSTLTIVSGSGANDDGYTDDTVGGDGYSDVTDSELPSINGHSILTQTYAVSPTRLKQLGNVLWNGTFIQNIELVNNNPIENIVSVKMFPFLINGAADEIIQLGNVETGVNGKPVPDSYSYKHNVGDIKITKKYNNFLDYAPFTKLTLFLPFVGFKELPTDEVMDRTINISYIIDIVTGTCKVVVSVILSGNKVPLVSYDGSVGIDIPISSSNRASVEAGYITSALGATSQMMSGNPIGAIGQGLDGAMSMYHTNTVGNPNPSCSIYECLDAFIIYDRPTYQNLKQFNHTRGRMCMLSKTIANINGFTVCDSNIDLNGINCTENEKAELQSILSSGFYA